MCECYSFILKILPCIKQEDKVLKISPSETAVLPTFSFVAFQNKNEKVTDKGSKFPVMKKVFIEKFEKRRTENSDSKSNNNHAWYIKVQ